MRKGKIFIISGPSGSGKTTLHKMLLASKKLTGNLVKSVSVTTRSKREGEIDGCDYFFLTQKQFLLKVKKDQFLEWQKVFDNYYGTPKDYVHKLLRKGKKVLLCIDVKGAAVVRHKEPHTIAIFIKVPSFFVLKERLLSRGSDSPESIKVRLSTARKEMLEAKKYDYVVINDDLKTALKELESIVTRELFFS